MVSTGQRYYELVQSSPNLLQQFTASSSSSDEHENPRSSGDGLKSSLTIINSSNNTDKKPRLLSTGHTKIRRRVSFAAADDDKHDEAATDKQSTVYHHRMSRSKSTTTLASMVMNSSGQNDDSAGQTRRSAYYTKKGSPKRFSNSSSEHRHNRQRRRQRKSAQRMNGRQQCQNCMIELRNQVERAIHAYKMVTSEDDPHLAPEERDQLGRALIHGFVEIQSRIGNLLGIVQKRREPEGHTRRRDSSQNSSRPTSSVNPRNLLKKVKDPNETISSNKNNNKIAAAESTKPDNNFSIDPQYLEDISNILLQMVQRKLQSSPTAVRSSSSTIPKSTTVSNH